jgi:uncharacterized protein YdeI (YjbR/CyaY-like superfamily)
VSRPKTGSITFSPPPVFDHIQNEHTFATAGAEHFSRPSLSFRDPRGERFTRGRFTTVSEEVVEIEAGNADEFRAWLQVNHVTSPAVWLIFWKKDSGHPSVEWGDAVDQALCFGWVDSKVQSLDEQRYRQYFSVRKPGSGWSKINKDKIERLTATGQMAPAGVAAVNRAKDDGSWAMLDGPEAGIVPDDLAAALDGAGVRSAYEELTPGGRKAILAWLVMAKRETTRANRIAKTIESLAAGESPI